MDDLVAKNVRMLREARNWSQQHLAETAGIALRTIQRVESAQGASRETLAALSNAFDAPVEFLQTDIEGIFEALRQHQDAVLATRDLIPVTPVESPAQLLDCVLGAGASLIKCLSTQDSIRDTFAALEASIRDLGDLASAMDPLEHREWSKEAFSYVEILQQQGMVVTAGRSRRPVGAGAKPVMEVDVAYVIVWPRGEEKPAIAVEKITSFA